MSLNVKHEEADRLARELAKETGETITSAVTVALRERLERVRGATRRRRLADDLDAIALRCAALPIVDERSDDDILGYDDRGLPS